MEVLGIVPQQHLLRCPRCGEVIDALSRECRYCHCLLDPAEARTAAERYRRFQEQESSSLERRTRWFAIRALLGIVAFVLLRVLGYYLLPTFGKSNIALGVAVFLLLAFLSVYAAQMARSDRL